ncbi:MAG: fluoride efflux transporter CrcB [Hyphomicrobiaceae bacterium]|nr:fluoride efflux transporter CrcB [Hyphomicrobiaceae bacterium]
MKLLLLAACGGAIGSAARYLVGVGMGRWLGVSAAFAWPTLVVNVVGCFLMGFLIETLALRLNGSQELRVFLATGVLGGFTTFSAFALDFSVLVGRKQELMAGLYVAASVGVSIVALYLGLWLARQVW